MTSTNNPIDPRQQVQFCAYRGRTDTESSQDVLNAITGGSRYVDIRHGKANVPRFTHGAYITKHRRHLAKVLWTPGQAEVFFEVSEGYCNGAIPRLREHVRHEVTSANVFVEASQPYCFEDILTRCIMIQKASPWTRGVRHGDWTDRRKSSRTFCLGSSSSECQIVLRQTPSKPDLYRRPENDLVRLEWRIHPEGKKQRSDAASYAPHQFLHLSELAESLADLVLDGRLICSPRGDALPGLTLTEQRFGEIVDGYSNLLYAMEQHEGGHDIVLNVMSAGLQALSTMHSPAAAQG